MTYTTETGTTTITLKIVSKPSRSKGSLWARIGDDAGAVFAGESARGNDATVTRGAVTVHLGGTVRRATRTEKLRGSRQIIATGNPDDTVQISFGSPQALVVMITGATEA